MKISAMQTLTLIDYPGQVAATVFTFGCSFRCHFCHNPELVLPSQKVKTLSEKDILEFLEKRKDFLDGLCITGGEPTIWKDLPEFIKKVKKKKLKVKLDTNGTNPEMLKDLIEKKLIDYVAMDIKAPWDKYENIVGKKIDIKKIKKSAKLLLDGKLDYEFRSTILPRLHPVKDIIQMAEQIKGAHKYYLQQFKPFAKMVNKEYINEKPYRQADLKKICIKIKPMFKKCEVRENV